jgi:hypothetical protein
LAHNWAKTDPEKSDCNALSAELKAIIHRLMSAALNRNISIRTRRMTFFIDDSFLSIVFDLHHFKRFLKCLRKDEFNKAYLDTIYLKRGDVLRWCQNEFLLPPPIWQTTIADISTSNEITDDSDDDKDNWYDKLSERRKQRITCLEIAKQLWKDNPELSYEQVRLHPIMTHYGYGASFTKDTFKKWARPFASDFAKKTRS